MIVPHQSLQPSTLRALIEAFVLREGTEYGEHDVAIDDKVAAVMQQLRDGSAVVTWDDDTQTASIESVHVRGRSRPTSEQP